MSEQPTSVIDVAAGLIFRKGKLLITQRHADSHLGGLWEFPGGKCEAGESFEQCLMRELREELGIDADVGALFEDITHTYPAKTVHLKFFLCRVGTQEPQPLGCASLKWVSRSEISEYPFPAADARLLEKLEGCVALWGGG